MLELIRTELDTLTEPSEHLDSFEATVIKAVTVIKAATHVFKVAENALGNNRNLDQVVVMETAQTDNIRSDPFRIKKDLAVPFNNTLDNCWKNSVLKSQIFLGLHLLHCSSSIREARFRQFETKKFNGIHYFGPSVKKALTLSTLDILKQAGVASSTYNSMIKEAQIKH